LWCRRARILPVLPEGCRMTRREEIRALMESEGITCAAATSRIRRADPEARERDYQYSRRWKTENREQNRVRDRVYSAREDVRGKCQACGGPMGVGVWHDGFCSSCREAGKLETWAEIKRRWAAGESFADIAKAFGWPRGRLSGEMARIREAGHDLPYRYRNTKRQRQEVAA
jgi:hypothetical protein